MNKLEIQEAILVSLDRDSKNTRTKENKDVYNMLSFTNIKTINCVVDEVRGNAIDLETGNVYHVIKRGRWGIVSQEEAENIRNSEKDTLFIYRFHEKNMDNISMLYQMFLNSRAQKKYQEYLKNIEIEESGKIKKLDKIITKKGK